MAQTATVRPGSPRADVRPGGARIRHRPAWLAGEVVLFLGAVGLYFGIRGMTEGRPAVAYHNAERVAALEHVLWLDYEQSLQRSAVGFPPLTRLANWVYVYGHWPVIVVVLLWLLVRHSDVFRRARNAMFASGVVGMVVFATFPVAPPRLYPRLGLVDTVTENLAAYRVLQPAAFTNQYAAMPSLHVGWNLIIGLAVWAAVSRRWLRIVGATLPIAMTLAVVLTANHFLLDAVAGGLLATVAWLAFRTMEAPVGTGPPAGLS